MLLNTPNGGGWGGRFELYKPDFSKTKKGGSPVEIAPETRAIWTDVIDFYTPYLQNEYGRAVKQDTVSFNDNKATLWRWRNDFQNDFAARMDWCIQTYEQANHPPVPVLGHSSEITIKSGEGFALDAYESYDPDGDNLSFLWFHYAEVSSLKTEITFIPENAHGAYFKAPNVDKKETFHIILKVSDKGTPQLSRYKRIIITVMP